MAAVAYGSLPFSEQIAFFRSKRNVLTESYLDVFGAEHDVAFMVAGANRDALLADLRDAIDRAIAGSDTLADFRKNFDRIVDQHGWSYTGGRNWRTRVIYETNLRQSYNAGRWQQLQALKRARPYWRYRHSDAVEHPRPIHLSWDGLVLHADDEWWHAHFPANGWGCQCYVEALNDRDLRRLGKSEPDQAPPIEMETLTVGQRSPGGPRLVQTPKGVDPGFGYAPGRSLGGRPPPGIPPSLARQLEEAAQHALQTTARLPAAAAAQSAEQVLALPRAIAAMDAGYAEWQAALLADRRARNSAYLVGALDREIITALTEAGIEPKTSAIVARDVEVLHALRDTKQIASVVTPRALSAAELTRLPLMLREPRAILLEVAVGRLLYVTNAERRGAAKVAIAIDYRLKTAEGREVVNAFRTAGLVDLADLRADVRSGKLVLLRGSL